jgi:hypothetical protein
MRHRLLLLCAICFFATPVRAAERNATITYVTAATIYIDAGSDAGLRVGDSLRVVREDGHSFSLIVRELSARRAACTLDGDSTEYPPIVGEVVHFDAVARSTRTGGSGAWSRSGMRGRVGLQWLSIRDLESAGRDLQRPAMDLRLSASSLFDRPIGVEADVRARRSKWSQGGDDEVRSRQRVYRLNIGFGAPDRTWRVVAGRQFAPALSVLHLFDGARLEFHRERWSAGLLGGTQPAPDDLGLSTDLREFGLWWSSRSLEGGDRWSVTTAAIGSYSKDEVDREFLYVQGRSTMGDWRLFGSQEVDFHRGWRSDAGGSTIASTSTLLRARYRPDSVWSFDAGLDLRQRVRRVRDIETPETDFDDRYRQGYSIGASRTLPGRSRLSLGIRTRARSDEESAHSATLSASTRPDLLAGARLSSRTTVYRNAMVEGWLQSARASWSPRPEVDLSAHGGVRHETGRDLDLMDGTDPWFGLAVDFTPHRATWIGLEWERTFSGDEAFEQIWAGTGLRF